MFFVVRLNDNFNFPLGLIKYIVIVIQLHDAHSKLLYVSAVTCPELIICIGFAERSSGDEIPKAYLVCAGVEPLAFQNLFPYWEPDTTIHSLALQVSLTWESHALILILIQDISLNPVHCVHYLSTEAN